MGSDLNGTYLRPKLALGRGLRKLVSRPYAAGMLHPSPQGWVYGVSRNKFPEVVAG